MDLKNLCALVLWMKVASALEGFFKLCQGDDTEEMPLLVGIIADEKPYLVIQFHLVFT